jgi:transcriptional antiterminator NusG
MSRDFSHWIAILVTSQHERKVEAHLRARAKKFGTDRIVDIFVPEETELRITEKGKKSTVVKSLPGYVLLQVQPVEGKISDDDIYVIRGTPHFIAFAGMDSKKPTYLHRSEVKTLFERCGESKIKVTNELKRKFEEGDHIEVISGPFKGFGGTVVSTGTKNLRVELNVFTQTTVVELPLSVVVLKKEK